MKLLARKLIQGALSTLPPAAHRYILSCYYNLPRLSLRSGFQVLGSMAEAQPDSITTSSFYLANGELVRKILARSDKPVIFDVGANIGQTSASYGSIFPTATIHAFEPFAENYQHLKENTKDLTGVQAHPLALSNEDGTLEVKRDHHPLSQWNSIAPTYQETLVERGRFTYETLELVQGDSFCERYGIGEISLLKIDTEGHEMEVLQGFKGGFANGSIMMVLVEVGFGLDKIHGRFQEVNSFLVEHDMFLCGFHDTDYLHDGSINFTNAIYCHSKILNDA